MTKRISVIYLITFIAAFCSIIYELLMAQTLTLLTGNSVVRYSTTIGLYLASLGLGAFLCSPKRLVRPVETLWKVEVLLSLVGGAAVALLYVSHTAYAYLMMDLYRTMGIILFFTCSYGVIAVIGLLSGFELPLLIHIREQEEEKTANLVLGVDYFASLTGAIIFALLLLPVLGVLRAGFVTAMLNILVAFVLLSFVREKGKKIFTVFSVFNLSIALALVLSLSFSSDIDQYFLKKYYYVWEPSETRRVLFSSMEAWPNVERYRSRYQNIDIVNRPARPFERLVYASYSSKYQNDPGYPNDHVLYLNGDYQFYSANEEVYHEYFAHLPIIANKVPRKVLVLGAGDGLLTRELVKYEDIESITQVDIDPEMIRLSTTHPVIRQMNQDSLMDPKVTVKVMDALYFIKTSQEKYDAIFIDFPVPNDYNLSKLYSREFYSFVRKSLKEDGFVVIDSPHSDPLTPKNNWVIYYNTIKAAGFETVIPYLSLLEEDNPGLYKKFEKEEWEAVRRMVAWRLRFLRFGFIMMRNDGNEINMEYKDYDVEMYVLNEKRYELAFKTDFPLPATTDWSKVNSIMRPTLPSTSPFEVKIP